MSVQNYYCKKCHYTSKNKYNFTKHCETKKHLKNYTPLSREDGPLSREDGPLSSEEKKYNKKFTCEYCGTEFLKKNKARHFKLCKIKKETVMGSEIEELRKLTNKLQEKLEKKDNIIEKRMQDMDRQFQELQSCTDVREKEMLKFMKSLALTNNSNITNNTTNNTKINNNNYNMYYIINNFTEAENIEDIMASPLTQEELDYIEKNGSILGSYKLIKDRCITDKDISKRPVHCTDIPRKKYLLRFNNEWIIDQQADKLLTMTFNKMKDAYDLDTNNVYDRLKNTNELINLDINGRKKINKQISSDVLLKNNINT